MPYYVNREDPDQPVPLCSLIRTFYVCWSILQYPVFFITRAQLFKTNDVVKTLIIKYGINANIFSEKM